MNLEQGQSASLSKTISESDVYTFAGLVGDFNGVHVNAVAAEKSIFKKQIAHGMLAGGLISAVLGTKLPGEGTIYLEQNLKFKKPVYFGDTLTATATVDKIIHVEKGIYHLDTVVTNQRGENVIEGYAVVKYTQEN